MYIILMAGGVGTRFWPLSRRSRPKQLLSIVGSKSMLRLTYERIRSLTDPSRILVITNMDLKNDVQAELPEIPPENIIGEPQGKNTAPCIGLGAAIVRARAGDGEVMVVLPADHLISDTDNFKATIQIGTVFAQKHDTLTTIGIKPTYPETGYGYIQVGELRETSNERNIYRVRTFAEKPNSETAERFLKSGDFLWNSGIFIWKTGKILKEVDEYLPELGSDLERITAAVGKKSFEKIIENVYSHTKAISIDYGVLETSEDVSVIAADFNWNDLGSWEAVYNISPKDNRGNVIHAEKNLILNAQNNYFYAKNKIIAAIDVEDLIVVEMDDALLICKREQSQNVKTIVDHLVRKGLEKYL
jgi:mannose-1-phosphate guanylyltransferase